MPLGTPVAAWLAGAALTRTTHHSKNSTTPDAPKSFTTPDHPMISVGSPAPDFTLPTDDGGAVTLSSLRGKYVVLFFYPKDDTSG